MIQKSKMEVISIILIPLVILALPLSLFLLRAYEVIFDYFIKLFLHSSALILLIYLFKVSINIGSKTIHSFYAGYKFFITLISFTGLLLISYTQFIFYLREKLHRYYGIDYNFYEINLVMFPVIILFGTIFGFYLMGKHHPIDGVKIKTNWGLFKGVILYFAIFFAVPYLIEKQFDILSPILTIFKVLLTLLYG